MAEVEKDFKELLKLFDKHEVRYCIVGAFAVAFHAIPRYTKVLDIFVDASRGNGEKIILALKEFGFGTLACKRKILRDQGFLCSWGSSRCAST